MQLHEIYEQLRQIHMVRSKSEFFSEILHPIIELSVRPALQKKGNQSFGPPEHRTADREETAWFADDIKSK